MAKKKISRLNVEKELAKVDLQIKKIESPKKSEPKKEEKKEDKDRKEEVSQANDFHESLENARASRRFTAPIILPSNFNSENIDNLEEFASALPSRAGEDKDDVNYSAGKSNYSGGTAGGYEGKGADYNLDVKYKASEDSLSSTNPNNRVTSSFIREDFARGKVMAESPSSSGAQVKTDWEDRSRLEEFSRIQDDYRSRQQQEHSEKRRRG